MVVQKVVLMAVKMASSRAGEKAAQTAVRWAAEKVAERAVLMADLLALSSADKRAALMVVPRVDSSVLSLVETKAALTAPC